MEVQMTDFENAAFAVFIVLLSRAIITMNVNFYIPISKVRRVRKALVTTSVACGMKLTNCVYGWGYIGRREHAPRTTARRGQPGQILLPSRDFHAHVVARHLRRSDT
jgi:hypothetical protein